MQQNKEPRFMRKWKRLTPGILFIALFAICGGDTLYAQQDEIIRAVYPRPGRIAVFDARIPHVAREPNRICPVVRYTIAMKLFLNP